MDIAKPQRVSSAIVKISRIAVSAETKTSLLPQKQAFLLLQKQEPDLLAGWWGLFL